MNKKVGSSGVVSRNKTFQKTEHKIIAQLIKDGRAHGFYCISVRELCREIGIAESTFYLHHHGLKDLVSCQAAILTASVISAKKFFVEYSPREKPRGPLRKQREYRERHLYFAVFYELQKHRDALNLLLEMKSPPAFDQIFESLRPLLYKERGTFPAHTKSIMFTRFKSLIIDELALWRTESNFSQKKIDTHARNLTKIAHHIYLLQRDIENQQEF